MTPDAARVLRGAAELLRPEGNWTKGDFAKNSMGFPCRAKSKSAVCWCVIGAFYKTAYELDAPIEDFQAACVALESVTERQGNLFSWNDDPGRAQAEVVAALEKAAELAEAQP